MSRQNELNEYIGRVQTRLRLGASLRGLAILTVSALVATLFLVWILNAYAFPERWLTPARGVLFAVVVAAALLGVALPLIRLSLRWSVARAETATPKFGQRLLTFHEREQAGGDAFLELLAADTLVVAQDAPVSRLVPGTVLMAFAAAALVCAGLLVWMVRAGPGYVGYGASLLWTGPKPDVAALYSIRVAPGDAAVRRHGDQLITAEVAGLSGEPVRLYARFGGAGGWEPVVMKPEEAGFQFLFTGLPDDVEYYVEAGRARSPRYKVRVVDLPTIRQMQVTYHYPRWTGMTAVTEDHAGDLRAIEGTEAELRIATDRPLKDGLLLLDGKAVRLTGGEGNVYRGSISMQKDGAYHLAATDTGQQVRLSEDFFIATEKASPPIIALVKPGADYRASPIEEVTIGVKASGEFGLNGMTLHYSVNGGPERSVNLLKQSGAKEASGTSTLALEDFKLVPGDVVSLYATAKDGHAEARTDISFIQADPFEREFEQSQQGGGGGGSGGGQQTSQTDISKRQKELIAATWKQQNDKAATSKQNSDAGQFLAEAQTKLRDQVLALAGRMESRDLASANEEFTSFGKDMQAAAAAMEPSSEKLKGGEWPEALPVEQKALQALLRAETTFRKIQVAFGQQSGGGGGGGGSAGRDLASLFDLELDTQKNQYEAAQTGGSAADREAKAVDDALAKLDALAKRQEELAQQQQKAPAGFEQRWQQEMLRREAEELQRQMEQMAQASQQGSLQSGESSSSSSSAKAGSGKVGQSQTASGKQGTSGQPSASGASADPRVEQALQRLRQANDAMKRGAGQGQATDASRQAAEQLRQATSLLSGKQRQQASGKLDGLSREAERLSLEEKAQAERFQGKAGGQAGQGQLAPSDRARLADDRQRLSDDLGHLEKGLRDTARELAPSQPGASSKLRDALGEMDQAELTNRVQRTADWMRRGISPSTGGTEGEIGKALERLSAQVGEARRGLGTGRDAKRGAGQDAGRQTAALDHVDRLREQIASLTGQGRQSGGSQPGQGGKGSRPGQGGKASQPGQPGQSSGQNGSAGGVGSPGRGESNTGRPEGDGTRSGDVGNRDPGGGGQGPAWDNVNTGNNRFGYTGPRVISPGAMTPATSERAYQDSLAELNQLRELARNDPAAAKEVQQLIREMQRLDPSRFPGNPTLVEQLHTQVLSAVDKLELELRRNLDGAPGGEVRTAKSASIAPGYEDAVAHYFRRLSKSP